MKLIQITMIKKLFTFAVLAASVAGASSFAQSNGLTDMS